MTDAPRATAPRFTILVAAYQAESTIREALFSLTAQSYPNWEAIVVDDGSSDATALIACGCAREDNRIRVYRRSNAGPALARNVAAEAARAPWLLALDADDSLLPCALERQAAFMEAHPGFDIYSLGTLLQDPDGSRRPWSVSSAHSGIESFTLDQMIEENLLTVTTVVSAERFRQLGGFRDLYLEDYDLWLRAFAAGSRHLHNPDPLAVYRVSQTSKNANFERRMASADAVLTDLARSPGLDRRQRRNALRRARLHRALGVRRHLEERLDQGETHRILRDYLSTADAYPNRLKWLGGVLLVCLCPRLFARLAPRLQTGSSNV